MVDHDTAIAIIESGRNYLLGFQGITEAILDQHLNEYQILHEQLQSLSDVYKAILMSARTKRHLPRVLPEIETLRDTLCEFDPNRVIQQYHNDYNNVQNQLELLEL